MFARHLGLAASSIVQRCFGSDAAGFASALLDFSSDLRRAIATHGIVPVRVFAPDGSARTETVYAYEVDGFGSSNLMDDANVPSLLSAPLFGYLPASDPVYQQTRKRILNQATNGYFMKGPIMNAVGGPHAGPGMAWPMASIVRIMTSDDDEDITSVLKELLAGTDGLGLMHESVNTFDASKWTRQW